MMRTTINRALLALIGLILFGGGLLVLAGGAGIYRHWNLTPPDGWPLGNQHDALVPHGDQARWAGQDWWWPATIAALAVLLLLAVTWLLAQIARGRRRSTLVLSDDPRSAVTIGTDVVSDAVTDELGDVPGVRHARATLSGPPSRLEARIELTLEPDSDPTPLLGRVAAAAERARTSIRESTLPVQVNLKVAPHPQHRVD